MLGLEVISGFFVYLEYLHIHNMISRMRPKSKHKIHVSYTLYTHNLKLILCNIFSTSVSWRWFIPCQMWNFCSHCDVDPWESEQWDILVSDGAARSASLILMFWGVKHWGWVFDQLVSEKAPPRCHFLKFLCHCVRDHTV